MVVLGKRDNSWDMEILMLFKIYFSYHNSNTLMILFKTHILKMVYHIYLCNKDQTVDAIELGNI